MRRRVTKQIVLWTVLLSMLLALPMGAGAAERRKIRVGFFAMDGYHEIDKDGDLTGYGYELMESLRRYGDFDFEYVGYEKSWAEMFEMLENGEIDVLSHVAVTPERQEKFLYSSTSVGNNGLIMTVKAGNRTIEQGNYATYEGKCIGFVRGIAENEIFEEFAREKGFSYQARYFDTEQELSQALQLGEIHCLVYTDFRDFGQEWIIERLAAPDVYLVVRKDDAALMEQLNVALERLDIRETGWQSRLKNTYFPYSGISTIFLSVYEQDAVTKFIQSGKTLRVTALPNDEPYSWYETDASGRVRPMGVYNQLFKELMDELEIPYKYVVPTDYEDYLRLIESGEIDIVVDMPRNLSYAEQNGYVTTPQHNSVALAKVYSRNFSGLIKKVAILKSAPYLADKVREIARNATIITYDSLQEAEDAVANGTVDVLFCLEHTAKVVVNRDERARFRIAVLNGYNSEFCFAVRSDLDRGIMSAISTAVLHSGSKIIQNFYDTNINFGVNQTPSLMAAFYNNPVPVVAVGAGIVMIVFALVIFLVYIRRRERERTLRAEIENNALISTMYSAMTFALLRLEIVDNEFRVIHANPHFLEMLGAKTLEEATARYQGGMGRGVLDRDRVDVSGMYSGLVQLGDHTTAESRVKLPDGSIRRMRCTSTLVDVTSRSRVVQQVVIDITDEYRAQERKAREHAEQALNLMFATLARRSSDIYVLYSLDDHATRFVSPNTEQLLGIPAARANENIRLLLDAELEGGGLWSEEKFRSIEQGNNLLGEVKRVHMESGEIRWYQDEAYVFTIGDERHLIIVMSDRTEERKNRDALQMALSNAENASKAKTTFLSNMSHDIRTPMNTILGLSSLLKNELGDPEKARGYLTNLEIAAGSMMEIINNVLDMSRIESGAETLTETPFSLRELLREIDAVSETQARVKELTIHADTDVDEDRYIGDALRLKQILLNLVSNAVKYTPRGGEIHLLATTLRRSTPLHSDLRFMVRDNGIGMSEEFLENLFSPFARERNTTNSGIIGTGLGMSIVKNLVDLMGGSIRVESTMGQGTTFYVDIPLRTEGAVSAQNQPENNMKNADITGVYLLVAEDNEMNAEILMELLQCEGARCDHAENGRAAVEKFLAAPPDTYDLILMDIQMPDMNGHDATREIRSSGHPRAKSIPIAAMTANAFTEDMEAAFAAGMDAHIPKPVDMPRLKAIICDLLEQKKE